MKSKLLGGAAALALSACAVAASIGPASAAPRHFGWGGALAAGVIGGTIAAATSPFWAATYYDYYPGYIYGRGYYNYVPVPAPAPAAVASCMARFRSFDPATGLYQGYDGLYHPCP